MQGMLLCLERETRLAYILGEIFEVTGREGCEILGISAPTFRKRLSRGRARLRDFMTRNCGLIHPENPCHCETVVDYDLAQGRIDPDNLQYANHPCLARRDPATPERLKELGELEKMAALFRGHPDYRAPDAFVRGLQGMLESGAFENFLQ